MISFPVGSIRAIGLKTSDGLCALGSWCAVKRIEGSWWFMPFTFVLACAGASFRVRESPPSTCGMSVAPLTVADRVRAMEFVSSEAPVAEGLLARRAEDDAVAVDCGSDAILEATL